MYHAQIRHHLAGIFSGAMNLKCPYCNCCYEVSDSLLQNPNKNDHLGYGWWLRCYKCGKKWWLGSAMQKLSLPTPPIADKAEKIARLSALVGVGRRRPRRRSFFGRVKWYVVIAALSMGACMMYQNRAMFRAYLVNKARHITEAGIKKVMMTDIKYFIEPENMILVTGNITNEDNVIVNVAGIKVSVFDGDTEVTAWRSELREDNLLPGQKISFSTEQKLPRAASNIRVEVSLF
jgi:hypothetical protein